MAGKEDACPMSEKAEIVVVGSSEIGGQPTAAEVKDHGVLEPAPVVDPLLAEEAAVAAESDSDSEINWVEMPLSYLRWVLSMTRETDPVPKLEDYGIYTPEDLDRKDPDMLIRRMIASVQTNEDSFFEYQAWVRETYLRNGRVMVPEDFLGPKDELQKAIKEAWGSGIVIDAASVGDADPEARDTDSSIKEVVPSKI